MSPGWSDAVIRHIVDVHCHPTDSPIGDDDVNNLPITICAMATRQSDQELVRKLALNSPQKVIPCFGYHPWFTHWISLHDPAEPKDKHYRDLFLDGQPDPGVDQAKVDAFERMLPSLPDPVALNDLLSGIRDNLEAFPNAMVGEVGLDRICRVPFDYQAPRKELSPFTIPIEHQVKVFEAQVDLAVELQRNVSVHSVRSVQSTVDVLGSLKKRHGHAWNRISVDMHSCGLSAEVWTRIEKSHSNVFLSLSTGINARSSAYKALLKAASLDRILVESDIHEIHQCAQRTWDMVNLVAEVRGLKVEEDWIDGEVPEDEWGVVRRLEANWKSFVRGRHVSPESLKEKKQFQKRGVDWYEGSDSEDS